MISDDDDDNDEAISHVEASDQTRRQTTIKSSVDGGVSSSLKFEETIRFDPTYQPTKITKIGRRNPLGDKIAQTRSQWLERYRHSFEDDGISPYRCILEIRVPKNYIEDNSKLAYGPYKSIPCVDLVKTILDVLSNRGSDKGLLTNDARIAHLESRIISNTWAMNSTFTVSVEITRMCLYPDSSQLYVNSISTPPGRHYTLTLDRHSAEIQPPKQIFMGSTPGYDKEQKARIADTISLLSMQNRETIEKIRLFMSKARALPSIVSIQVYYPRTLKAKKSSALSWKLSSPDIDNVSRLLIVAMTTLSLISTTSVTQLSARKLIVASDTMPSTQITLFFL